MLDRPRRIPPLLPRSTGRSAWNRLTALARSCRDAAALRRLTEIACRWAFLVVGIWVAIAGGLNIAVPQLEHVVSERAGPFIPQSAPSLATLSAMGAQFGESSATAIGYLVIEDPTGITETDRHFYSDLVGTIRRNAADVDSVQDLIGSPATAPTATSKDGKAVYAIVRFYGGMGSAEQRRGQEFVDSVLAHQIPPTGVRAYLTGPAPTIGDELTTTDNTVALITGLSVVMIVALLLLVYRSVTTILVPLASVGLALAVARPIVALLALHAGLDVSIFSIMLLAALILGGGTDYAIFVVSGYHNARRDGVPPGHRAILAASGRTSGVIVASGLTVAASCAVMALTKVVLFRTAGLACSLGMLLAVAAALTLVPALMSILAGRGLLEPKGRGRSLLWRRLGITVVRRPVAVFALSAGVLGLLAAQVPRMSTGYDERAMQPSSTISNQGYAAIARHYDPNELTPDYLVIRSDHDLRNAAGFSAVNAVSRAIQRVPGVKEVRSATQPEGHPIPEFSLAQQDRLIADKMDAAITQLTASRPQLQRLTDGITRLDDGLDQIASGNALAANGSGAIANGSAKLRDGLGTAYDSSGELSTGADQLAAGSLELANGIETAVKPILGLLDTLAPPPAGNACPPDSGCDTNAQLELLAQDHSLAGQLRYTLTRLMTGSRQLADGNQRLADGARQLRDGLARAASGSVSLADGQQLLTTKLDELSHAAAAAKAGTDQISGGVNQLAPQMQTLVDGLIQARNFLAEVGTSVGDGPDAGFYVPKAAFSDSRLLQEVMKYFLSSDGHTTRVIVINATSAYSPEAIARLHAITAAAHDSLSRTSLAGSKIDATGLAAGFRDLHDMVMADFALIAGCALVFIFLILVSLLRSLLAPLYLIVTIALSYAAALGLTVLVWQECLGIDIYWAVPPLAFVALVAVGSDYNMMLMSWIHAESATGLNTGISRAFKATGGVVSTAGVIFALTMLAMLASPAHSIGQVGFTIGAGLLLDTFVVRALTVPAIAALLGQRNWWPQRARRHFTDSAYNPDLQRAEDVPVFMEFEVAVPTRRTRRRRRGAGRRTGRARRTRSPSRSPGRRRGCAPRRPPPHTRRRARSRPPAPTARARPPGSTRRARGPVRHGHGARPVRQPRGPYRQPRAARRGWRARRGSRQVVRSACTGSRAAGARHRSSR
ncbi:MAG TPA: RND family transporter [Mycobacterium sp.]|nr:RND family transporter [Mycobacterium sp.]